MGKTYKDERQFDRKRDLREQREHKDSEKWGIDDGSDLNRQQSPTPPRGPRMSMSPPPPRPSRGR